MEPFPTRLKVAEHKPQRRPSTSYYWYPHSLPSAGRSQTGVNFCEFVATQCRVLHPPSSTATTLTVQRRFHCFAITLLFHIHEGLCDPTQWIHCLFSLPHCPCTQCKFSVHPTGLESKPLSFSRHPHFIPLQTIAVFLCLSHSDWP